MTVCSRFKVQSFKFKLLGNGTPKPGQSRATVAKLGTLPRVPTMLLAITSHPSRAISSINLPLVQRSLSAELPQPGIIPNVLHSRPRVNKRSRAWGLSSLDLNTQLHCIIPLIFDAFFGILKEVLF